MQAESQQASRRSLVEDIIKLSRLDENDQSIPMEEVDLMQTCRDVEGHLSIRAKEQQVKSDTERSELPDQRCKTGSL